MVAELREYLNCIRDNLRIDRLSEREVTIELENHIEDRLQELKSAGFSEEEAASICVRLLGSAKLVARKIYEAHSQGSWRQVLLTSMPHILFGLLFTLNWLQGIGWLLIMLVLVLGMVIYGWWHGKPSWLFPWLGYSLLPVVIAGLLLLYLPRGWSWVTIVLYIPLALWLVCSVVVQTIKKDWLYFPLMLFPVPIIISWLMTVGQGKIYPDFSLERFYNFAPWIGLSFMALAITAAVFIRLRQRWLKAAVLLLLEIIILTMIACADGELSLIAFASLILVFICLFLTPVFLERKIKYYRQHYIV
ncbi:MAG: permease prefix domain 1-containing protein [Dehalococcoidales bacterium]|nr:permease prefix domain 1-containing protein [Dehalococcoidales bacterium]